MESNLNKVPAPVVVPETEPITVPTRPKEVPEEDDPFRVPGPLINPTPKGWSKS